VVNTNRNGLYGGSIFKETAGTVIHLSTETAGTVIHLSTETAGTVIHLSTETEVWWDNKVG
jgi:hypothetical protein